MNAVVVLIVLHRVVHLKTTFVEWKTQAPCRKNEIRSMSQATAVE
jgi:hypothetical protein